MKTSTKMKIYETLIDAGCFGGALIVSVVFINVFLYLLSNLI